MPSSILSPKSALTALLLLLGGLGPALAQQAHTAPAPGVWLTLNSDARLSRRLGLHTDLHWRGAQPATRTPAQNQLRLGLNLHLGPQAVVTAGYAYAHALPPDDGGRPGLVGTTEQRLFQQVQFGEHTGALWTRHRYRLEEGWLRAAAAGAGRTYRTRLRYQLRLLLPLSRDHQLRPGTAYLVGANELFIHIGGPSFFDQNRLSLLLGLQLSTTTALEAGLVRQSVAAGTGLDGGPGNVLQVGFTLSPDLRHGQALRVEKNGE